MTPPHLASSPGPDPRISRLIEVAEELQKGHFDIAVPCAGDDTLGRLGQTLDELSHTLALRQREVENLIRITERINTGLWLDELLDRVFDDFSDLIPYDRIGFSLIENENMVRALWARSRMPQIFLTKNYAAPLHGSSLETIIQTGQPRIINDLQSYLENKPSSVSTPLILKEGLLSSLTCPLIANGHPIGFIFFSSAQTNTYRDKDTETFLRVANILSVTLQKGRLLTELSSQKEKIEHQNEELQKLDQIKNRFLGMAAHDLRNPLSNIAMIADLLQDKEAPLSSDERDSFLKDISAQTHYMLALINDLLEVTRMETGNLSLHPVAVNLGTFLQETVRRHNTLATHKRTHVLCSDTPPHASVLADPVRLRQIFDNLISNAVKFSPPQSTIRVTAELRSGQWRIAVQDQGPGLHPAEREKLFVEFSKLGARPTAGESSTGLGLFITRRLVEAHNGKIGADSQSGRGATFWIELPNIQ
jgi:signal transduction histidine kinase